MLGIGGLLNFIKRHKRKFIFGGFLAGGTFFLHELWIVIKIKLDMMLSFAYEGQSYIYSNSFGFVDNTQICCGIRPVCLVNLFAWSLPSLGVLCPMYIRRIGIIQEMLKQWNGPLWLVVA